MIKKFLFIFWVLTPMSLFGQLSCKYLSLRAQQEIDDFPKNYQHCDTFYSVEITQQNGPVFNLDSLARITELHDLKIFGIDSLESIKGLNQLKKVENFHFVALRKFDPFLLLDTIVSLSYEVDYEGADLTLFQNVKHISLAIRVINDIRLIGLPSFTSKNGFWIDVENNSLENDISNLVPNNINSLQWLWLKDNVNLSLSGMEMMDTIKQNYFYNNKNCNISFIKDVKRIGYFLSSSEDIIENQYPSFMEVKELDVLSFDKVQNLVRIDSIFPNLELINRSIDLKNNPFLVDIKILDNFPINKFTPIPGSIIYMVNNPLLENCLSPFICNVLAAFPTKVTMSGNSTLCNKPELIEACITDTYEAVEVDLTLYPNPAFHTLHWVSEDKINHLKILNREGQVLLHKTTPDQVVDISELIPGMYFVQIFGSKHTYIRKFTKW